jgi:hypothetical protein
MASGEPGVMMGELLSMPNAQLENAQCPTAGTKDQGPRTKDQGPRTKDQGPRTKPTIPAVPMRSREESLNQDEKP